MCNGVPSVWPPVAYISEHFGNDVARQAVLVTLKFLENFTSETASCAKFANASNFSTELNGQGNNGQLVDVYQQDVVNIPGINDMWMDIGVNPSGSLPKDPVCSQESVPAVNNSRTDRRRRNRRKKRKTEKRMKQLKTELASEKAKLSTLRLRLETAKLESGIRAVETKMSLSPLVEEAKRAELEVRVAKAKAKSSTNTPITPVFKSPLAKMSDEVLAPYLKPAVRDDVDSGNQKLTVDTQVVTKAKKPDKKVGSALSAYDKFIADALVNRPHLFSGPRAQAKYFSGSVDT